MSTQQPIRIMLDLETMSLEDNAAIVQIGAAVIGNSWKNLSIYVKPESAEKAGLHVSKDTMDWWDKQDATVRTRVFGGVENIQDALTTLSIWVKDTCSGDLSRLRLYCNGPESDWVWIRSAFYRVFGNFPFPYRAPQSLRTLYDVADLVQLVLPETRPNNNHDALQDAINQADIAQWIFDHLQSKVDWP